MPDNFMLKQEKNGRVLFELTLVLMVSIVPAIFSSLTYSPSIERQYFSSFSSHALSMLFRSLRDIVLILFIISHSGHGFAVFGIRRLRVPLDIVEGIGLWGLSRLMYRLVWMGLPFVLTRSDYWSLVYHQYHPYFSAPAKISDYALLMVSCFANGTAEELVMRAYLITRLEGLIESKYIAILLSTIIFAIYHGYQGIAGVISATILGCIYGISYCVFRRLAPIAIAHAIADCLAEIRFS